MKKALLVGAAACCVARAASSPAAGPAVVFTDVTRAAGIRFNHVNGAFGKKYLPETMGSGAAFLDYDGDGWPDIFLVNSRNWPGHPGPRSFPALYRNNHDGTFSDVTQAAGLALEVYGLGVTAADYDNDGRTDIYLTALGGNHLFHNLGDGRFADVTVAAGVANGGFSTSAAFFDYDNDGLLDLVSVNGHVYPQLDFAKRGAAAGYRQRKLLYHNRGDGTFDELGAQAGPVFTEERVSRGLAVGDLDNDGRLDLVINDLDGAPQVLRNQVEGAGHWLLVHLRGRGQMTDAIGAVVTVQAGPLRQMRNVRSGTSYLSQDDMRQHFGLGKAAQADAVLVLWPDGTKTKLENVKADQVLEVRQPE